MRSAGRIYEVASIIPPHDFEPRAVCKMSRLGRPQTPHARTRPSSPLNTILKWPTTPMTSDSGDSPTPKRHREVCAIKRDGKKERLNFDDSASAASLWVLWRVHGQWGVKPRAMIQVNRQFCCRLPHPFDPTCDVVASKPL